VPNPPAAQEKGLFEQGGGERCGGDPGERGFDLGKKKKKLGGGEPRPNLFYPGFEEEKKPRGENKKPHHKFPGFGRGNFGTPQPKKKKKQQKNPGGARGGGNLCFARFVSDWHVGAFGRTRGGAPAEKPHTRKNTITLSQLFLPLQPPPLVCLLRGLEEGGGGRNLRTGIWLRFFSGAGCREKSSSAPKPGGKKTAKVCFRGSVQKKKKKVFGTGGGPGGGGKKNTNHCGFYGAAG